MQVLISGAGIGGLTAARLLHARGHHVTLIERASEFRPVGAGIVLAPNAVRILERAGIDLATAGRPLPWMRIVDARDRPIQTLDFEAVRGAHGPVYALSRADLHAALTKSLPGDIDLRLGDHLVHIEDSAAQLRVGTNAGEIVPADLLVGADGLRSDVRRLTLGDLPLRYSGQTCWRALCQNPGLEGALEVWSGRARLGAVPLSGGRLYVYLVLAAPRGVPDLAASGGLLRHFAHLRGTAAKVVGALEGASFLHHDLEELERPVWGLRRIVLLGDAAHAMTPNQGQGAAMAIEDAWVLAGELEAGTDGLLERFTRSRHDRVRRVQLASRQLGVIAQWRSTPIQAVRNALFRSLPASATIRRYQSLLQPGIELLQQKSHRHHQ